MNHFQVGRATISLVERQRCAIESVFGLEEVDQKPYNSSTKPYSPNLAPCDFWAFPTMIRELRGKKFQSGQVVKTVCSTILLKLAANGLQHVFEKWVERCKKCVACQGGTSKKRPSPHLHKVPIRSNKVSPRTFQMALVIICVVYRQFKLT
jgi:hypothetical protein